MAGNQVTGDGLSVNLAGMSKNQLYDIMSQMKTLIEQNQDQARQILIQNPLLTKALFQAQIMLGMLQPPQEIPKIQPTGTQHSTQQATPPAQQSTGQNPPLPVQSNLRDQTSAPIPTSSISPSNPSLPSHPLQLSRSHMSTQSAPTLPSPQSSNMAALSLHHSTPQPSVIQQSMPPASTPLQQPLHIGSMPHLPLQPPLPPQPRPSSLPPAFPHQNYPHMGPNAGFQHQGAPQMHHSQSMFHSGSRPPTSVGLPFSQGQPPLPNQQLSQTLYQGGGSHVGMDFNQMGIPTQPGRGSTWMPESATGTGTGTLLSGASPPFLPPHMSPGTQPPRPASLTADMEKALLQQVMSLTPEQINLLQLDQRNQVLQLQQMLRQ